jgi:hypothetical protein
MKFLSFLFTSVLLMPAVGMAGSISGGGGDTVPANPVGNAAIAEILKESRSTLLMYFRNIDAGPGKWPTNEGDDRRLFGGSPTIYDVINETVIESQSSAPCRDGDGIEVDGSIVTTNGGICISLQRLGAKLDRTNAFSQTVALVAHELSHKLGFNEDEAIQLQKDMLDRLEEKNVSSRAVADYVTDSSWSALLAADLAQKLIDSEDLSNWNSNCRNANELAESYERYSDKLHSVFDTYRAPVLSIYPRKHQGNANAFRVKTLILRYATCGQANPPLRSPVDTELYARYTAAFADRTEMTFSEFFSAFFGLPDQTNGNKVKILKVDSGTAAATEATTIREYLGQIRDLARDLGKPSQVTIIP